MFCPKCGTEIQDGQKFCSNCGSEIATNQPAVIPQQKKPKKKSKLSFVLIAIVLFFVILIAAIGSGNQPSTSSKENSRQSNTTTTETTTKDTQYLENTISITASYASEPDYAGGVDYHFEFTNKSDKEIKYVTINVTPYNAVGDAVTCQIRMKSQFSGKVTGPIAPGESYGEDKVFRGAWYNTTISSVEIDSITIDYMDGSSVSITDKDDIKQITAF